MVADEPRGVVDELDVLALGEVVDRAAAVAREVRGVLVLGLDHFLEVDFGDTREPVVVAHLEAMGRRREDLLRRHAPAEDAEAAAGFAVVDEGEVDVLLGEAVRHRDARAAVGSDDNDVHDRGTNSGV